MIVKHMSLQYSTNTNVQEADSETTMKEEKSEDSDEKPAVKEEDV